MIEVSKLKRYLLCVEIRRVSLIVLIAELFNPLGDLQFGPLALSLDIEILFHVNLAVNEVYYRLLLALLRLIGPEVLDFALLGPGLEASDASFLLSFDLHQIVKLLLFLVDDLSGLILELVEHLAVILLALRLVVGELQLHSRGIVSVFLDP